MTTKQQEIMAPNQTRDIINGLDKDGYIATAFEGCLDIAESNIRNDWACSMQQRAESAEAAAEKANSEAEELQRKLEKAQTRIANLEDELGAARADTEELKKKVLPEDLRGAIKAHLLNAIEEKEENMKGLADIMADLAGNPNDIAFLHAANSYKLQRARCKNYQNMIKKLDEIA